MRKLLILLILFPLTVYASPSVIIDGKEYEQCRELSRVMYKGRCTFKNQVIGDLQHIKSMTRMKAQLAAQQEEGNRRRKEKQATIAQQKVELNRGKKEKEAAYWKQQEEGNRLRKEEQARYDAQQAEGNRLARIARDKRDAEEQAKGERYDNVVSAFRAKIKAHGFTEYRSLTVVSALGALLYDPDLYDEFLNSIIFGCVDKLIETKCHNKDWRKLTTVQQVIPKYVMYSAYVADTSVSFLLQKDDKPYMAGQVLRLGAYVLTGTHTYATAIGSTRTLPVIKRIN